MKEESFIRIMQAMEAGLGGQGYFAKFSLRDGRILVGSYALPFGGRTLLGPVAILDYAENDPPAIYVDVEDIVTFSGPIMEVKHAS